MDFMEEREVMDTAFKAAFDIDHVDYVKMNGDELVNFCQDNGMKWAMAFKKISKKLFDIDIDLMYMFGWFAAAIENSHQYKENMKNVQPSSLLLEEENDA